MKLEYLTIIFIIIILPISFILGEYTKNQLETLNLQITYDSKLESATADAIKAFQLNTVNSSTSDLANSKMRDIEAAVNMFFTMVASNFNMAGYNSEIIKDYVPALVYTLYDGYYIYSPFINTLTDTEVLQDSKYQNNDKIYGLKPYVYYSCRYKGNGELDVVITYALDNYITVQGTDINGNGINIAGCLINNIPETQIEENTVTYRGVTISKGEELSEYIGGTKYKYVKINGVKYYKDESTNTWFSLLNGERKYILKSLKKESSDAAYLYYKEAAEFKKQLEYAGILNLKQSDAVIDNKQNINGFNTDEYIFKYEDRGVSIEEPNSKFNEHRLAVIRYSIEKNLSIAIANYNNHSGVLNDFQMPKLEEQEWNLILNNVCLVSFLQGLNIGGKIYNGYSVVPNNKNEEVVAEETIYIGQNFDDGEYYNIWDTTISQSEDFNSRNYTGILNIDLERKSIKGEDGFLYYYYPKKQLKSYTSMLYQSNTDPDYDGNVYKYLDNKPELAKVYYTALGRERYSMYKVNRDPDQAKQYYTD